MYWKSFIDNLFLKGKESRCIKKLKCNNESLFSLVMKKLGFPNASQDGNTFLTFFILPSYRYCLKKWNFSSLLGCLAQIVSFMCQRINVSLYKKNTKHQPYMPNYGKIQYKNNTTNYINWQAKSWMQNEIQQHIYIHIQIRKVVREGKTYKL
jgi:hypothetical protein